MPKDDFPNEIANLHKSVSFVSNAEKTPLQDSGLICGREPLKAACPKSRLNRFFRPMPPTGRLGRPRYIPTHPHRCFFVFSSPSKVPVISHPQQFNLCCVCLWPSSKVLSEGSMKKVRSSAFNSQAAALRIVLMSSKMRICFLLNKLFAISRAASSAMPHCAEASRAPTIGSNHGHSMNTLQRFRAHPNAEADFVFEQGVCNLERAWRAKNAKSNFLLLRRSLRALEMFKR